MDSEITVNHSVYKIAGKLLLACSFFSSSSSNFLPEYSSKYFSWFRFRKRTDFGLYNDKTYS